jgi:hypothetical protein
VRLGDLRAREPQPQQLLACQQPVLRLRKRQASLAAQQRDELLFRFIGQNHQNPPAFRLNAPKWSF